MLVKPEFDSTATFRQNNWQIASDNELTISNEAQAEQILNDNFAALSGGADLRLFYDVNGFLTVKETASPSPFYRSSAAYLICFNEHREPIVCHSAQMPLAAGIGFISQVRFQYFNEK